MSTSSSSLAVVGGGTGVRPNGRNRFRVRRCCLTLNNPTAAECVSWSSLVLLGNQSGDSAENLTFFVVQSERSESGTFHYQAYAEFRKQIGVREIKALFGSRVHIEGARGNASQSIIYCTKASTRVTGEALCVAGTWGTAKQSGSTLMATLSIMQGDDLSDVMEKYPMQVMLYGSRLEKLKCRLKGVRNSIPSMSIFTGLTGSGKSRFAQKTWPKAYWVAPPAAGGRVWWGGYTGERVVIFDDFHSGWFKLTTLLRFMDSHPLKVAPKGSQVEFTSTHLVLTSNVDPRDWYGGYTGKVAHKDALERRIMEFATIFDCSVDGDGVYFRDRRTDVFKFRESFGLGQTAGVGDMSSGNGYNQDDLF